MMKTLRNVLILSLMSICLTACSSDDNESESTINGVAAPTINGKRLVKIKHGETYTALEYNAQGQVSKVKYHSKDGTIREDSYRYEANRIIWNSGADIEYRMKEGRVTECSYTALTSLERNAMTVNVKDVYSYNNDGCLIRQSRPNDLAEEGSVENVSYTWRNGNIISVLVSDTSKDTVPKEEYDIEYSSIENNIPLFFTYFYSNNAYLEWQGCFDQRCKHLPQSVTFTNLTMDPSWDGQAITHTYNYTLEDGLVKKITVKSITDKGKSSQDVYELEWW